MLMLPKKSTRLPKNKAAGCWLIKGSVLLPLQFFFSHFFEWKSSWATWAGSGWARPGTPNGAQAGLAQAFSGPSHWLPKLASLIVVRSQNRTNKSFGMENDSYGKFSFLGQFLNKICNLTNSKKRIKLTRVNYNMIKGNKNLRLKNLWLTRHKP